MKIGEKKHLGAYDVMRVDRSTLRFTDTGEPAVAAGRTALAEALGKCLRKAKVPVSFKERVGEVVIDCYPTEVPMVLTTVVRNATVEAPLDAFEMPQFVTENTFIVDAKAAEQVEVLAEQAYRVLHKLMLSLGLQLVQVSFTYGYCSELGLMIDNLLHCDTMLVADKDGVIIRDDWVLLRALKECSKRTVAAVAA